MNSKVMTRMCLIAAGGLLGLAAQADTWYFTGNETSTDTGAFTDATKWKDASGTAATAADAVRAMLPTTPPRHFAGGTMTWTEKATEDCVTFCVRCRRPATAIYLR